MVSAFVACGGGSNASDAGDAGSETGGSSISGGSTGGSTAADTPLPVTTRRVGSGADYSCAIRTDGVVKCWGRNDRGQNGVGNTEAHGDEPNEMGDKLAAVDLKARAVSLAVGWYHACALLEGGAVKCWGSNNSGQLAVGDTRDRGVKPGEVSALAAIDLGHDRPVVAIAAGDGFNCVAFDDGRLKCWGQNDLGQLGLGDREGRGDAPNEMGARLPFVDLGQGARVKGISLGSGHACAVLTDGRVKCWGGAAEGQLGLGDTRLRGTLPADTGDGLAAVDLGKGARAVAVALGAYHSCAVLDDGRAKCWGNSERGQLGLGDTTTRGAAAGQMGDALPAVDLGGRRVKELSSLYDHTCAIVDDDSLRCWGWNKDGQLGLGDTKDRGSQPNQMGTKLPRVDLGTGRSLRSLGIGWDHSCALLDDGNFKCWGLNGAGYLGQGDTKTRGSAPGQMGDALLPVKL
jgi:alpha-tubulin suppressor-like RCC1 family protein